MTPVEQMTDAEIVAGVRAGNLVLVPVSDASAPVVGEMGLDDWDGIDGQTGLLLRLSREECRFVAPQVFGKWGEAKA